MKSNDSDQGWDRPAVTFRLTRRRAADLRAIAMDSTAPLSPTAAIDLAISMALAVNERQELAEISAIDEAIDEIREMAAASKRQAAAHQASLAEAAAHVKELRDVLRAAASGTSEEDGVAKIGTLDALEWIEQEARALPTPSFLATARWQSKTRLDDVRFAIDLMMERVAATGLSGVAARGLPARIRLSNLDRESPLSHIDDTRCAYVMCQRHAPGWMLSLHPMLQDGSPGESWGSISL